MNIKTPDPECTPTPLPAPPMTATDKFFKVFVAVAISIAGALGFLVSAGIIFFLLTFKGCC